MNYFELHLGDYDKATSHLTACEDGIYGRLLRRYYDTEMPLPCDLKSVQRLARAHTREEKKSVEAILEEFFESREDGWHHQRCDEEIKRYKAKRAKAQASANARWMKQQDACEGNANACQDAMRTHCEGNASQSPDTSNAVDTALSADRPRSARKAEPGHSPARQAPDDPDPEATPAGGCDPEAWGAFVAHHRQIGRWTAARSLLAAGQLRTLAAAGVDTGEVLRWATLRGLSDLADCHRRMQADAAKAAAADRLPGESLADACYRRGRAKAAGQPTAAPMAASGSLAAELLALTAEGADR